MGLDYFLSEKEGLVVISLKGDFGVASGALLLRCLQESLSKKPRGIVIHFAEVRSLPRDAFRDFGRFLRDIRVNGTPMKLALAEPRLRLELVQAGLADRAEVRESLEEAARQVWERIRAGAA